MFEAEWSNFNKIPEEIKDLKINNNPYYFPKKYKAMYIHWEEHCFECSPPHCYNNCILFLKRKDGKCSNLEYGFVENTKINSLIFPAVEIKFRKWAKIESRITNIYISKNSLRFIKKINYFCIKFINIINKFKIFNYFYIKKHKTVYDILYSIRYRLGNLLFHKKKRIVPDIFIFSCYSYHKKNFKLIFESNFFKVSKEIYNGWNTFYIPIDKELCVNDIFKIYPENDLQVKLLLQSADFFKLSKNELNKIKYSDKIKCIVWDLDNTLWSGVFIEGEVKIKKEIVNLIKNLDKRGFLNSIVSKNSDKNIVKFLKKNNLMDYFVYPQINWKNKSLNIQNISKNLNINLNTIVFVDDNPFEREEVKINFPSVRVFDITDLDAIKDLLKTKEITEEAKNRRISYQKEEKRKLISDKEFNNKYLDFIKYCNINVNIFKPSTESDYKRCKELLQRTNQLNLNGFKYNDESFNNIIRNINNIYYAIEVNDRFGSYGIVGFLIINFKNTTIEINEMAISCRVANKFIEITILKFLKDHFKLFSNIIIKFQESEININFITILQKIGFTKKTNYLIAKINNLDFSNNINDYILKK